MQSTISFSKIEHPVYQVAELQVAYKRKCPIAQMPVIKRSKDAYQVLIDSWNMDKIDMQEHVKIMLLDRANRVLGIHELATGGISGVVIDPKLVFGLALKACASSIVMAHNHPSGSLQASRQDLEITKKLVEAGKVLDLPVVDHVIVTSESYLSMVDEGIFPY